MKLEIRKLEIKTILKLVILFISYSCWSQQIGIEKLSVKTPETSNFIRYGNTPISEFTGEISQNIALCNLKVNNSNFDISLHHTSAGYIPNIRPGIVGHNWFINYGGVISRTVRWQADDIKDYSIVNGGNPMSGFLIGTRQNPYKNSDVFDLVPSTGSYAPSYLLSSGENRYEGESDIYIFNFMGISGKFYIGNDGKAKVITDTPTTIKIDLSLMAEQIFPDDEFNCTPNVSSIKITDEKGTVYFFGGSISSMEYSINLGTINQYNSFNPHYKTINAWYLKKVQYLNGDVLDFTYRDIKSNLFCTPKSLDSTNKDQDLLSVNKYWSETINAVNSTNCNYDYTSLDPCGYTNGSNHNYNFSCELLKKCILDKIKGPDFEVDFEYTPQDFLFYNNRDWTYNINYRDIKLSKIRLKDFNNVETKKIDFIYSYYGKNFKRMFLSKLFINETENYSFDYYDTENFPNPETKGVDYWGFWNGDDNSNSLIPNMKFNPTSGEVNIIGDIRKPNPSLYKVGLLKRITYPTKGYSNFYYENHSYSSRLERNSKNNFLPALNSITGILGNARIKEIINFDGNSNTEIKKYFYSKDFNPNVNNTISSGILMSWPLYLRNIKMIGGGGFLYNFTFLSSNNFNASENKLITYGEVTEMTVGNGYKVKKFSDYESHPDVADFNHLYLGNGYIGQPEMYSKNIKVNLNSREFERGKLLSEKIFDPNHALKSELRLKYNVSNSRFDNYIANMTTSLIWGHSYKIYFYNNYLTESATTTYTSTGHLTITENYDYSNALNTNSWGNDLLIKKRRYSSANNDTFEIQYKYPWEIYAPGEILDNFKSANITSPIKESAFKNDVKLTEQQIVYAKNPTTSNLMLPKEIFMAKFPNSLENLSDSGSLGKKLTYHKYDDRGNPLEVSLENGVHTTFIWGYNKTLLIAKLENATYTDVIQYETNLQRLSNSIDEDALKTELNKLRDYLPNAMITTYTYKPLIGVSSITDVKGFVTTYKYDAYNRLEKIIDKDNNLLHWYNYNYIDVVKYYNNLKSGIFTKNNCPSDYIGTTLTYTVPDGIYSSTISQEDADIKAQTDLDNNGQNYVNQNGTCHFLFKNILKSETFESENCYENQVPIPIVYSVQAGKYSSIISQSDADAKAQEDIDLNGQEYANLNGRCRTITLK